MEQNHQNLMWGGGGKNIRNNFGILSSVELLSEDQQQQNQKNIFQKIQAQHQQELASSTRIFEQHHQIQNSRQDGSNINQMQVGKEIPQSLFTTKNLVLNDFKETSELMKQRFENFKNNTGIQMQSFNNINMNGEGNFRSDNNIFSTNKEIIIGQTMAASSSINCSSTSNTNKIFAKEHNMILGNFSTNQATSTSTSSTVNKLPLDDAADRNIPTSKTLTNLNEMTTTTIEQQKRQMFVSQTNSITSRVPKTSTSMNELLLKNSAEENLKNFISNVPQSSGATFRNTIDDQIIIPSLDNFVSPFRKLPFGFRNFNRSLWPDIKNDDNRQTWDTNEIFKMSVGVSASQQTFFESINGNVREFKDQRLCVRHSYVASESESDEDEDEETEAIKSIKPKKNKLKSITFKPKPAITFPVSPKFASDSVIPPPPSEIDDTSSVATISDLDQDKRLEEVNENLQKTPEHRKSIKVAQELLSTERTYVRLLHLIDQVFHFKVDNENRKSQPMFPPNVVEQMFCNIKSLYKLHHDHLLPQLENRIANCESEDSTSIGIGKIMKDISPFLKIYSEYVQNFDNSINLINIYKEKCPRFAQIIEDIQKMEECANLPIQHHLICPIQRIPRYRLLLEAYLRRLPTDSDDREDTEKALELVSKSAEHANEAMRRIASFKKLLEVQEMIKGVVDLVSPTRILLREGRIHKISARTGDHQERYLYLFSDVVLLCSYRTMVNLRLSTQSPYQLRAKLDVLNITVNEGDDLEVINTFYIQDSTKRIELYTETSEDKQAWMEALYRARIDLIERKSSLKLSPTDDDIGFREPAKLKSDSVTKCMECQIPFSMLKRKHHCHACGIVICAKCSGTKLPLHYAGGKLCRVCNTCKKLIGEKGHIRKLPIDSPSASSLDEPFMKIQGVLDVSTNENSVLKGFLHLRLRGKKEWNQRFFMLRSDFVLYCYTTDNEDKAMTATPMPGLSVCMVEELPKSDINILASEKDRAFRIVNPHGRKTFLFLSPTREEALTWSQTLQMAAKADLLNWPAMLNNNSSS